MDPKNVLERYTAAVLNEHQLDRLDEFTTSDRLKAAATGLVDAFPDLRVDIVFMIGEGSLVACHASGAGTHTGTPIRGVDPAGKSWTANCNAFFKVEDGRIVQAWTIWDWASILKQISTESPT